MVKSQSSPYLTCQQHLTLFFPPLTWYISFSWFLEHHTLLVFLLPWWSFRFSLSLMISSFLSWPLNTGHTQGWVSVFFSALSMLTHLIISFSPMAFNINMFMASSLAQTRLAYSLKLLRHMINNQFNISNQVLNSQFKFSMFKTKVEYFLQTLSSCSQLIAISSLQFVRQKTWFFFLWHPTSNLSWNPVELYFQNIHRIKLLFTISTDQPMVQITSSLVCVIGTVSELVS